MKGWAKAFKRRTCGKYEGGRMPWNWLSISRGSHREDALKKGPCCCCCCVNRCCWRCWNSCCSEDEGGVNWEGFWGEFWELFDWKGWRKDARAAKEGSRLEKFFDDLDRCLLNQKRQPIDAFIVRSPREKPTGGECNFISASSSRKQISSPRKQYPIF